MFFQSVYGQEKVFINEEEAIRAYRDVAIPLLKDPKKLFDFEYAKVVMDVTKLLLQDGNTHLTDLSIAVQIYCEDRVKTTSDTKRWRAYVEFAKKVENEVFRQYEETASKKQIKTAESKENDMDVQQFIEISKAWQNEEMKNNSELNKVFMDCIKYVSKKDVEKRKDSLVFSELMLNYLTGSLYSMGQSDRNYSKSEWKNLTTCLYLSNTTRLYILSDLEKQKETLPKNSTIKRK
jgi:hypothetical protein